MLKLILTEKPSVATDFSKALSINTKKNGYFEGKGYIITWAVGHLVELFEPDDYDKSLKKWKLSTLPVIPDKFRYKSIKKNYRQLSLINSLLNRNDITEVIVATDAGREGEVIARTILMNSGFMDKSKIKRFWTSQALVPEVVLRELNNLKPITDYDRLWRAGYYRQVADWLVGMNFTRVLTLKLNDLFSAGRVQTAVLAMLTERKNVRDNFIPETYWQLKVNFTNEKGEWTGLWFKNKNSRIIVQKNFEDILRKCSSEKSPGVVTEITKTDKSELPPQLFSLTDLQQEANIKYGFPAKKTLAIAQNLYQNKKCLSYPRTDSRVLGTQNIQLVNDVIKSLAPVYKDMFKNIVREKINVSNKRVFNDKKLTDHHALMPFKPLPRNASEDEKKIYMLVAGRFAAAFHASCFFETTNIITEFAGETFKTNGKIIRSKGWREVYNPAFSKKDDEIILPQLAKGDPAFKKSVKEEKKKTLPPPEYTDASLLKDMTNPAKFVSEHNIKKIFRGEVGIGTQSTRAQIIETLIARKYVNRSGKKILPTPKGCFLIETLKHNEISGILTSPEETARWETELNSIALGESARSEFLNEIKKFVFNGVQELKSSTMKSQVFQPVQKQKTKQKKNPAEKLTCPLCGGVIIEGKKGYGCSNWRPEKGNCRFVIWKTIAGKKITDKILANILNGKKTRLSNLEINGQKFKGRLQLKKSEYKVFIEAVPDHDDNSLKPYQISCSR